MSNDREEEQGLGKTAQIQSAVLSSNSPREPQYKCTSANVILYIIACFCIVMLGLSLPVYQVRLDWLPLPCTALIRPSQLSCLGTCIVHPESFRSNAQNAIAFARRNRPRFNRNDEFACVYLRLRSFASTVCDRPHARTCMRTRARTYIGKVWVWHYLR